MLPYFTLSDLLPSVNCIDGVESNTFVNVIFMSAYVFAFIFVKVVLPHSIIFGKFTKLLFSIKIDVNTPKIFSANYSNSLLFKHILLYIKTFSAPPSIPCKRTCVLLL